MARRVNEVDQKAIAVDALLYMHHVLLLKLIVHGNGPGVGVCMRSMCAAEEVEQTQ